MELYAGEKAQRVTGEVLPRETLEAIREFKVAIKGPLTTPVGSGFRSLNVTIRQALDLYACVRPIRYIPGVPSPVKHPEQVDFVIFRENTEDVYAGLEWERGTPEAKRLMEFLRDEFGVQIRPDSGLGVKPISEFGTKRLVRKAIQYALQNNRRRVTLVHKGNIMKYTEGAFRHEGKILINDRIADIMFQHVLTRPKEFEVIATPNLNGDYLSDACAAQVGGVGIAPGANLGDELGVFEATHGTAPSHADGARGARPHDPAEARDLRSGPPHGGRHPAAHQRVRPGRRREHGRRPRGRPDAMTEPSVVEPVPADGRFALVDAQSPRSSRRASRTPFPRRSERWTSWGSRPRPSPTSPSPTSTWTTRAGRASWPSDAPTLK